MAPDDGLLRCEKLVGDGSGGIKRGSTAWNCIGIHGHQGGNRSGGARSEAEAFMRITPHGNLTEVFRALDIAKIETPEKTDTKSNSTVMK